MRNEGLQMQLHPIKHTAQSGFTMIELLISMAIGLLIIAALSSTFVTQRQSYDIQQQITAAVQTARAAMDMISRELRLAGYDPTDIGLIGIPYSADQLQVLADLDGDGLTTSPNEDIIYKYNLEDMQITRNTGGGDQPFAENAQEFAFDYLDANGSSTADAAQIRQVKIALTIRTEKPDPDYSDNGGYRTVKLSSYVTPRNLAF